MSVTYLMDCVNDFNCSKNATGGRSGNGASCQTENIVGGMGTTIWGPLTNDLELPPYGTTTVGGFFTCTQPQCYQGGNFCNITYTVHTEQDAQSGRDYVGPITMTFTSALGTGSSHRYHSRLAGHDLTETQDAAQFKDSNQNIIFDDTGPNTLSFTNCDPSVTVWIKGLQIVRGYGMCQLPCDSSQQCNGGTCNGSGTPCSTNQTQSGSNDLAPRQDYPCNYENCGGMSCTGFFYDNHNGTLLQRGTTYSWTWTNPNASFGSYNSYAGSSHCLFNLNNVTIPSNQGNATTPDIPFQLSLDNTNWKTFYHSRTNAGANGESFNMAHGVDLATDSFLSQYYDDRPNYPNTLYLRIPTNPDPGVDLQLNDGADGRINLYRVYRTKNVYSVTAYPGSGGYILDPNKTNIAWGGRFGVNSGDTPRVWVVPSNGHYPSGAYVNGSAVSLSWSSQYQFYYYDFPTGITENKEIAVYFNQCYGQISCYPSNAGSISCSPNPPSCTANTIFTANETADYKFDYWQADVNWNLFDNPLTLNISGINQFVAIFAPATYITASVNDASRGSISPAGTVKVKQGSTPVFIVTPNVGSMITYVQQDNNSPIQVNSSNAYYSYFYVGAGTHTITAYFAAQPTLVINAIDQYWGWNTAYPNVYVDGVLQQWAGDTIALGFSSSGSHTVTVDDPYWDSDWSIYSNFQCMVDGDSNYYGNGDSVPVSGVTYLTIYYQA